MSHKTLKNLPESVRPYERFLDLGAQSLSDAELLAIILKSGSREQSALELATELLGTSQANLLNLYELTFEELMEHKGIGKVKAIQLKAVAELSRRIAQTYHRIEDYMDNPKMIAEHYMETLRHRKTEVFVAAYFDAKCKFLGDAVIASGSANCAYVSPADVLRIALQKNAVQFVAIHNHPSGDPSPSDSDIELTTRLYDGARLLGVQLSDHVIIGDKCYYSFLNRHMLPT